ncbi:MAG TPA: phosphoribosyltransferase family protein, partial [Nitrososphaeraceae archaeon]
MEATIDEKRNRLKEIIKARGIVIRDVTLSSNKKSKFYYDIKSIVGEAEGAALIGQLMLATILKLEPKTRSVGGLESGAIAIATAIVCSSFQLEPAYRVSGFFVRKITKDYGLEKTVEGIVKTPVAVVDDVITTGKSVLHAVTALRNLGISEINIVSVIDREAKENLLNQNNTQFHSIFRHVEFA